MYVHVYVYVSDVYAYDYAYVYCIWLHACMYMYEYAKKIALTRLVRDVLARLSRTLKQWARNTHPASERDEKKIMDKYVPVPYSMQSGPSHP